MSELKVTDLQAVLRRHAIAHGIDLTAGPSRVRIHGKDYFHAAPTMTLHPINDNPLSYNNLSSQIQLHLPQENAHTVVVNTGTEPERRFRPLANIHVPGYFRTYDNELHHHLAHQPNDVRSGPAYFNEDNETIHFNMDKSHLQENMKTFSDFVTHARSLPSPQKMEYDSFHHKVQSTTPKDLDSRKFNLHSALELERRQQVGMHMPKGTENLLGIRVFGGSKSTPYLYDFQTEQLIPAHDLSIDKAYH